MAAPRWGRRSPRCSWTALTEYTCTRAWRGRGTAACPGPGPWCCRAGTRVPAARRGRPRGTATCWWSRGRGWSWRATRAAPSPGPGPARTRGCTRSPPAAAWSSPRRTGRTWARTRVTTRGQTAHGAPWTPSCTPSLPRCWAENSVQYLFVDDVHCDLKH